MQVVKKEAVHVGHGVKMRVKHGRLRISVPCGKRWRGSMLFVLYLGFLVISDGYRFLPGLISQWLVAVRSGAIWSSAFWMPLAHVCLWLAVAGLGVCGLLWFLLGHYVLEIDDKSMRAGRSLLGIEFLSKHDTDGVRRVRFSPSLILEGGRNDASRTSWQVPRGKLFRRGRYTLHLDYGAKLREVLRMAIEENQVRTIKGILRAYCPHLYQNSLKSEAAAHFNDQIMDILYLKNQIKDVAKNE